MTENEISYQIRGAIFDVYNHFGPGLYESAYEAALMIELAKRGLQPKRQVPIEVRYKEEPLNLGFVADIIVNGLVIIEIKSVENLSEVHHKQLLTYLRLTNLKPGILANFNTDDISKSIFRKVNNL
jgi:GxxExxY protein